TNRPVPYVSVTNEFDFQLVGELLDESEPMRPGRGQPFLLRSKMLLKVGWEAFEVYPPFDPKVWQSDLASTWAELDLLAAAARRNLHDQQLREIDPNAAARKQFTSLFNEFRLLLEGPEEPVQQFIKNHPE